jgi:SAM-dependent methyltransferase
VTVLLKDRVRSYWQADPCGVSTTSFEPGTREFYDDVERQRDRLEPFIPSFAEFELWKDKDVLEIGTGLGTDFVRFGRAGARLHGVDLTEASIELVGRRLALEGLTADLRQGDAESLPYENASFDLVYSWGVLHHTPDTDQALREVRRVLRPGGEARLMLYSRRSWVALGLWLRHGLLRGKPGRTFQDVVANHMESAGTKAYTQAELEALLAPSFSRVQYRRFTTPYDRKLGGPLVDLFSERFGWFVGIRALP